MAQQYRCITAGPLVVECIYPSVGTRDSDGVRAGKRRVSSEAQQRMNLIYAYQRLEMELAANFVRGDIVATLTYDDEHLPSDRATVIRDLQRTVRALRPVWAAAGAELRYIYRVEHVHGEGRWHIHLVCNATGDDYGALQAAWGRGHVEAHPFRVDRDQNYETLARYLCKEKRDRLGHRLWSCSRNLRKPVRDSRRVGNDQELTPPPGVTVLMDTGDVRTAYGRYRYIKYLVGGWASASGRPRTRRRRRPRRIS